MRKILPILVLAAVLVVPNLVLAVPTISLNGPSTVTLTVGDTYTDQGATAKAGDGTTDISGNIVVAGAKVNTALAGSYAQSYTITDNDGTMAEAIRTVIVNAAEATGGVVPGETMPEGLSPCTMKHDVRGCADNCSEKGSAGNKCLIEACCLLDRVYTIADWIFVILLVVAGIFILWGGLEFVTSAGDPDKVGSARNKLLWALIGVIVAFVSRGLVRLIAQIIK